ncbi:hypothetical protein [Streptomyces sp. NPDC000410]
MGCDNDAEGCEQFTIGNGAEKRYPRQSPPSHRAPERPCADGGTGHQ